MESGAAFGDEAVIGAETLVSREAVGAMVTRYFVASTAVLFAAGALGVIMRQSQANLVRVSPNFFYAAMTAHGLGAFVAWAGFAVMGFGYWVLESVGFKLRPLAYGLGQAAFWTMVVGTVGIVCTTVIFGFGGSWVFLYPLPFHSASQWGHVTTAVFAFSVLLAGVSIITWSVSMLMAATGPSSPAQKSGVLNRMGVALGMAILWPKRFPVREPLPYAVLPLTVIALDMIIATLPLALLLVEMIVQAFAPSVTVDPLLAKNVLWFFGHPVVYLLLFPAVSIYYLLIPRYAKKPLVAGNAIAVAWLMAVVVNVIIWAHHVYLDYPNDTLQSSLNTIAQPLTFSITLVSALSLFSLSATIWRSEFEWTIGAKFLAAGLIGWFTAGLSGVVNATITFNTQVHNTLWVVGHFHQMALLNIGVVVFAAAYEFVPELWHRQWYSRRLGEWHLWLTLVGGYGMIILWLSQGLTGAPRRWAVLPSKYDAQTIASLAFIALIVLGQLVFAWNVIQTARGNRRERDELNLVRDEWQLAMVFCTAVIAIAPVAAVAIKRGNAKSTAAAPAGSAAAGAVLFSQTCSACHTLAAAGASGTVGPNLDQLKPSQARVLNALKIGGTGDGRMPANLYTGTQALAVAKYVSSVAGTK
ncbi:MAG TPA: cbb3-type cytochrome c oxidase subunit I [Solirubrobacteraceae bacterium]|nr:cbb3-type cytochrome c oxidase subunit I [Solirubrobacteraceae bacterium]